MYIKRMKYKRMKPIYRIICFLIASIIVFLLADAKIRPIMRSIAETQAKNISTQVINNVVNDILSDESLSYNTLVTIEKNNQGEIIAIQTNALKTNQLKSKISTKIAEKIASIEKNQMRIPIGSILGSELLSGRGPKIKMYYSLSGNAVTEITNNFDSAGINQTRHQIMLNITTNIYIVLPGDKTSTQLQTNIIIAETVIVGNVPEMYAGLGDTIEKITQK